MLLLITHLLADAGNDFLTEGVKIASSKISELSDSFESLSTGFSKTSDSSLDLKTSFSDFYSTCSSSLPSGATFPDVTDYDSYIDEFSDSCISISDILAALPDPLNKVHKLIYRIVGTRLLTHSLTRTRAKTTYDRTALTRRT